MLEEGSPSHPGPEVLRVGRRGRLALETGGVGLCVLGARHLLSPSPWASATFLILLALGLYPPQ